MIGCSIQVFNIRTTDSSKVTYEEFSHSLPAQESEIKTWHHDCSNMSGFRDDIVPEFPFDTDEGWEDTKGVIQSDGENFILTNITGPVFNMRDYYGPAYICDLPDIFPVSGLRHLQVQLELTTSHENVSAVGIALLDETLSPVLLASSYDRSDRSIRTYITLQYFPRNFSLLDEFFWRDLNEYRLADVETSGFANATLSASYNQYQEIIGNITTWGSEPIPTEVFVNKNYTEPARSINYVAIMMGGFDFHYDPLFHDSIRIDDILLEYETNRLIDITPPLLTPWLDINYVVGTKGNTINWRCTDDYPYRYWLLEFTLGDWVFDHEYINSSEGPWNGSDFEISVDGLEIGYPFHTYVLILQDRAGFMTCDWVTVRVTEHPFTIFLRTFAIKIGVLSFVALVSIFIVWYAIKHPPPKSTAQLLKDAYKKPKG